MTLTNRGEYHYGDSQADIRDEILHYSTLNGYLAQHFADAVCTCSHRTFALSLDDATGVAVRTCDACGVVHPMGDSDQFMEDARPEECACPCGNERFEITIGVSLYADSRDMKWLYLGCRCPRCGLTAVYGDWKNEYEGYEDFLGRI